jgi:hypothetical protein
MRILVKFPSRGRPEKLKQVLTKYVTMAINPSNMVFMVTLDSNDSTVTMELIDSLIAIHPNISVRVGISGTKVKAINRDMEYAPFFDILLLASDDMIPELYGYDEIIKNHMHRFYPDTDGVLWFNDGKRGKELNTLSILGKKYYDRFGYIYHPAYKSFYCDNEFMDIANRLGKQTYIDTVIIRHVHVTQDPSLDDDTYRINTIFADEDRQLYLDRKVTNGALSFLKHVKFPLKRML